MRALIVHNPRSGFGSDAIFEFERALLFAGDECVFRVLEEEKRVDECLRDAEAFDVVVVSGGDGTVSHALYALRDRGVPTCVFPSGTANLMAANIGNATEPKALAVACRELKVAMCDLGEISWEQGGVQHKEGLALMGGCGLDAQLMHDAIPTKELLGEAAYFTAIMENTHADQVTYTIEVDGETFVHKGLCCLVTNNSMMQGEIEIVPGSSMADGLLDVVVFESTSTPGLLKPLLAGIMDPLGKGIGRPDTAIYRGTNVRIQTDRPTKMEIDGDVVYGEVSDWSARVLPACVPLVVDDLSRYA